MTPTLRIPVKLYDSFSYFKIVASPPITRASQVGPQKVRVVTPKTSLFPGPPEKQGRGADPSGGLPGTGGGGGDGNGAAGGVHGTASPACC